MNPIFLIKAVSLTCFFFFILTVFSFMVISSLWKNLFAISKEKSHLQITYSSLPILVPKLIQIFSWILRLVNESFLSEFSNFLFQYAPETLFP